MELKLIYVPLNRYALILKCWEADVDERLCFKEIVETLGEVPGNKTVV